MDESKLSEVKQACLDHADDLVKASNQLLGDGLPHLAYHMAVLALEEVGKVAVILMEAASVHPIDMERSFDKLKEDHIKKLFWGLWVPFIITGRVTGTEIETHRVLAKRIHETRLAGLYVDWRGDTLSLPKSIITAADAKELIGLTEARIGMERSYEIRKLDEADVAVVRWFLESTQDEERGDLIFGNKSIMKLNELKDPSAWVRWLKEQFDAAQREGDELLKREMARQEPAGEARARQKWKLKIRFHTNSHSVRQRPLAWWNSISRDIKLFRGRDHTQLIADFMLPMAIPLEGVWSAGWGHSRRLIVALNISSLGFFWWQVPQDVSRFFESLEDIEAKAEVRAQRKPRLTLAWGNHVLDEKVLRDTAVVFGSLPFRDEVEKHEPFDHYLTGLGFLGKSDIHLQFETNAFFEFFMALKSGMRVYSDWDGQASFIDAVTKVVEANWPSLTSWRELVDIGEEVQRGRKPPREITLSDVGGMKIFSDLYFRNVLLEKVLEERHGQQGRKESASRSC